MGIILYEMATGERPFKGDTAASLLSSILKDKPQSATEVNPALPRDLGRSSVGASSRTPSIVIKRPRIFGMSWKT